MSNDDDTSSNDDFVQLVLELPAPIDPAVAKLKITYSASDPSPETSNPDRFTRSGTGTSEDPYVCSPPAGDGRLRIWTKDANADRDWRSVSLLSLGDYVPPGEYSDLAKLGFSASVRTQTFFVEGIKASDTVGDQQIKMELDPDGDGPLGWVCYDAVRTTVLQVEFVDSKPDYALGEDADTPETTDDDCDNFFLRQDDDYKNLDIYYRILPEGLSLNEVLIRIYEEDSTLPAVIFPGETDISSGTYKTGDNLHSAWDDARDASGDFRLAGYYRVELFVVPTGSTATPFKTPIDDADPDMPGWQCPQNGLGIHDLVWKHRPELYVGTNEEVSPNGPCYPFDSNIIPQYRLRRTDKSEISWSPSPCPYNDYPDFPSPGSDFTDPSYKYQVLKDTVDQDPLNSWSVSELAIDMQGNTETSDSDKPILQGSGVSAWLGYRGVPTTNHVFIQLWMYETASYSPYMPGQTFNHDADWEMTQLCIQQKDVAQPGNKTRWLLPWAATASQHYYGQTLAWRLDKQGGPTGTLAGLTKENQRYVLHSTATPERIKLYISENAHATYFQPGSINCNIFAKCGTSVQYDDPDFWDGAYDRCTPLTDDIDIKLFPLFLDGGKGIWDWAGKWGTKSGAGPAVPSPVFRHVDLADGAPLIISGNEKDFSNACRKTVGPTGEYSNTGSHDPETELHE